jgi:hypothetical protein
MLLEYLQTSTWSWKSAIYRTHSEHVGSVLSHFLFCALHLEHAVLAGPEEDRALIFRYVAFDL